MRKCKNLIAFIFLFSSLFLTACHEHRPISQQDSNINLVLRMFEDVTQAKNINAVDNYYSPDFILQSNNMKLTLEQFKQRLQREFVYYNNLAIANPIPDIFAYQDKVAMRYVLITTDKKNIAHEINIISIFLLQHNKIHRWWEVTYPDWKSEIK